MKNMLLFLFSLAGIGAMVISSRNAHALFFPGAAEERLEVAKLQCQLHIDFPFNPDMSCTERLAFPFLED
jgi:hypothetical protein